MNTSAQSVRADFDLHIAPMTELNRVTNPLSAAKPPLDDETAWEEAAWRQVQARDREAGFFYAVTTTGVFCFPWCASRRPLRANARFFRTAQEAQAAGFRPCKKCSPMSDESPRAAGRSVDKVRAHIERNLDRAVKLEELGRIAGMSPFTVQRLFKREMGASPLQYQRALRANSLRGALKGGSSVTDAIYAAGFGSSSRAYDGSSLGMTPARFRDGGRGEQIGWAVAQSPFGWMIVGATARGLCWLALAATKAEAEATLRAEFPEAELRRDQSLERLVDAALASVRAGTDLFANGSSERLDLRGTVFQLRVWQALRQIPRGETRTYSQLAREMGQPNATRAVARACALNRVSVVVPCHRVVGANGSLTGYRWGVERKQKLLAAEKANSRQ
ncbi:MAG TPA: methylated-DNA--[protein]-cysteine S-methyltransferase [Terracidiphilus sp.]|nr:methylated-DNA--[protein]-cysteine S-methyltransferase [Terracidiphilus sp.]